MKKILCVFFALMMLMAISAHAETGPNLIRNGDFSEIDAAGMPVHWKKDMWFTDAGVSRLYIAEDGYDGNSAAIINFSDNDARFCQTIAVEPDSYYRFTCIAKAESCGEEGYGATLSIEDTFVYSNEILDSNGQWETLELYGRTGEKQTEVTVMIRIGGYSMINNGTAWFDNVEVVKLDALPEGVEAQYLYRETSSQSSVNTDTNAVPKRNTETWLLMAALYGVLVLALVRRNHRLNSVKDVKSLLWIGFGAALLARLVIAFLVRGYNTDINCFSAWSERIFANGPAKFYSSDYFCDYPPLYMLMLWPAALIRSVLGLAVQSGLHIVLLKLIPIVCDLLGALLIFRFAEKKKWHGAWAAALALLYAFNPAAIIDSAAWGQIDSVFTLLIAVCALMACDEKYVLSLVAFAAAMLVKPQALLFAPLGLFAILVNLIRAKSLRKLRDFVLGVLAALGTIYALAFVFYIGRAEGFTDAITGPVRWLVELYGSTMSGYSYLTVNALNLYNVFGLNWTATASAPVWTTLAWILFALAYLYTAFLYAGSVKRRLPLCGGLLIALIFTFGPMIHERYIFPALILLSLAYVQDRDRRILICLTVMTITTALNEILVLQGGMTAANYGHLDSAEQWLNGLLSCINVINALYLSWIALDICMLNHKVPVISNPETFEHAETAVEKDHRLHLRRKDYLLMAAVALIYSVVAFTNLGTTAAPQTSWVSTASGESIVFDLGEKHDFTMIYYGGICDSTFDVEFSDDGEFWSEPDEARYDQGEIFRWIFHCADGSSQPLAMNARYLRITAHSAGLKLSEFGFRDVQSGELLPVRIALHSNYTPGFENPAEALIDEQHTVVETPSYYNSSYFDEIYHARTAYELLHGEYAYEWTHPHLGKILMMVGIQLFGMCPFGWRFMGALIGVLMLPVMYLLAKQLTKSTKLSFIAMFLLAVDSMHFTQTRIATIDSYAVFWIMLMYLFMFRYAQMDWKKLSLGRTLVPLGLCGVTMGVAWATKWIGIYGSVGLATIFFWKIIAELVRAGEYRRAFVRRSLITVGFCLIFYVVIPVMIYYFSYYPQLRYEGVASIWDMFSGRWIKRIVELQESILGYHAGLGGDTHYFRSPWYQWPVVWWPMWYYSGANYMPEGMVSSISCMGNPAVWWAGLVALIAVLIICAWRRKAEKNWLLVLIGFASQFLPWVLVPRSTFIYHYFASIPFIILCTSLMIGWLKDKNPKAAKHSAIGLMAAALVLFIAFYPLESGYPVAESYAKYLRWFKWYNY